MSKMFTSESEEDAKPVVHDTSSLRPMLRKRGSNPWAMGGGAGRVGAIDEDEKMIEEAETMTGETMMKNLGSSGIWKRAVRTTSPIW